MAQAGLKTVIFLSFVLALSFLLVILSCALWSNWLPLLTALVFALAPLPNFLFSRCGGADDFSADYSSGPTDFGHFLTSCFLVTGVALPFTLAHAGVIHSLAGWMSAIGGAVGYGTMITYSHFFAIQIEDY
ncbi:Vps55p [Sporobolomyces koalae]|uniref:Vps55p n=1 Tax=Sporobolomyces koalae TaxID=500713 RepID=UPI0031813255